MVCVCVCVYKVISCFYRYVSGHAKKHFEESQVVGPSQKKGEKQEKEKSHHSVCMDCSNYSVFWWVSFMTGLSGATICGALHKRPVMDCNGVVKGTRCFIIIVHLLRLISFFVSDPTFFWSHIRNDHMLMTTLSNYNYMKDYLMNISVAKCRMPPQWTHYSIFMVAVFPIQIWMALSLNMYIVLSPD